MAFQSKETAIHLKNNSSLPNQAYQASGMMFLICCVLGMTIPFKGDPVEFFFPVVAILSLALARFTERSSEKDFAILYADRFEEPCFRDTRRVVHWNQVTSLCWTGSTEENACLTVYTKEFETPLGFIGMNLNNLRVEDRLTFIRYVKCSAVNIPQERWPAFCRRLAVPWLKVEENKKDGDSEESQPLSFQEKISVGGIKAVVSHPFLSGLLMPVSFLLALPLMFSRAACWTMAAILTVSSIINIRLVWGAWIDPFTSVTLGTAAVFFVLGIFSLPREPHGKTSQETTNAAIALGYLVVFLIGMPLAVNALEKGWLPGNLAMPLKWLSLALFFAPMFILIFGPRNTDKHSVEDQEQEAIRYWNAREAE